MRKNTGSVAQAMRRSKETPLNYRGLGPHQARPKPQARRSISKGHERTTETTDNNAFNAAKVG